MHLRPFQAIFPVKEKLNSAYDFFERVKEDYNFFWQDGYFRYSETTAFYVYQIEDAKGVYNGIIAAIDANDFFEGKIIGHENTLSDKEAKQKELLLQRQVSVKPILLSYEAVPEINDWMEQIIQSNPPDYEIIEHQMNEKHRIWSVASAESIRYIQELFTHQVEKTFIADGHHRTLANASLYRDFKGNGIIKNPFSDIFCALFPSNFLKIYDFNRFVQLTESMDKNAFLEQLAHYCSIKPLKTGARPQRKGEITMFFKDHWLDLEWNAEISALYTASMDVSILNEVIFGKILGIKNIKTDPRVNYFPGYYDVETIEKITAANGPGAAFCLFPLSVSEVFAFAERGEMLPPKSTWFEPRLRNGIIVKPFSK